jgi:hypothetical protein
MRTFIPRRARAAPVKQHYAFMRKLLPYIISYLIVATGTAVYPHIYRHLVSQPPIAFPSDTVALISISGLSQAELDAKLRQVGLSEAHPHPGKVPPSYSYLDHYAFDAVTLSAFAGLVILFRRIFQANIPNHDHAA